MSQVRVMLGESGLSTFDFEWHAGQMFVNPTLDQPDGYLIPGLIDIHFHGAFGIDFMTASKSEMIELSNKLMDVGYEGFLPTTITSDAQSVANAINQLPDHEAILGFHLEGPFISPTFPGAQPIEHIKTYDSFSQEWSQILNHPQLRIVTLAPETAGAGKLIAAMTERGAISSMGHTAATYDEAKSAQFLGANHITHTFNAMRPLHHREVGCLGFGLTEPQVSCELIYDRVHVSKEAAQILFKCKGRDKIIGVSDSSAATGLKPGTELKMWGHDCIVHQGEVRIKHSGALAGSAVHLFDVFKNLFDDFGPELAIASCCDNPRNALKLSSEPKVWLDLDPNLQIRQIYRA